MTPARRVTVVVCGAVLGAAALCAAAPAVTAAGRSVIYTPTSLKGVDLSGSWEAPSGMWFIIGPGDSVIIDPYVVSLNQVPYSPSGRGGLKLKYEKSSDPHNSPGLIDIEYNGNLGPGPSLLEFDTYMHEGEFSLCGSLDPDDPCNPPYVFTKIQ